MLPAEPASDGGSAPARWPEIAAVNIEPSAAMPVAMPTCRKVRVDTGRHAGLLRRDDADGGGRERRVDQAAAEAGDDEPGNQVRPVRGAAEPGHQQQPDADEQQARTDQPAGRHLLGQPSRDHRGDQLRRGKDGDPQPAPSAE